MGGHISLFRPVTVSDTMINPLINLLDIYNYIFINLIKHIPVHYRCPSSSHHGPYATFAVQDCQF